MDALIFLGRTLGFSFAARHQPLRDCRPPRACVTVRLGRASPEYQVFDNSWIIGTALFLYAIEFFADKIPWIDSAWDTLHTFIRPLGGALIALTALGDASPAMETMVALLGGTVAASTHFTKAGTRVVANASPEPFSNWFLSMGEDVFVVGLGFLALKYPIAALAVVAVLLVVIAVSATWLVRALKRRFGRREAIPG